MNCLKINGLRKDFGWDYRGYGFPMTPHPFWLVPGCLGWNAAPFNLHQFALRRIGLLSGRMRRQQVVCVDPPVHQDR